MPNYESVDGVHNPGEKKRKRFDRGVQGGEQSGKMDSEDLCMWNERETRGYGKKLRVTTCRRVVIKFSFPNRNIELWNRLEEEVVFAKNIHDFKE